MVRSSYQGRDVERLQACCPLSDLWQPLRQREYELHFNRSSITPNLQIILEMIMVSLRSKIRKGTSTSAGSQNEQDPRYLYLILPADGLDLSDDYATNMTINLG